MCVGLHRRLLVDVDHSCGGSTGLFTGFPFHPGLDDAGHLHAFIARTSAHSAEVGMKLSSSGFLLSTAGGVTRGGQARLQFGVFEIIHRDHLQADFAHVKQQLGVLT